MRNRLNISLIAAIGKNRELGRENKLVFNLKKDMDHFKEKTSGHVAIMGRKTYESIGRALPDRVNIVITRDVNYKIVEGVIRVESIDQALEVARNEEFKKNGEDFGEIFIIGGAQIYEAFLPYANKLYLTIVGKKVKDADAFFPEYKDEFKKIISSKGEEENGTRFTFVELEK